LLPFVTVSAVSGHAHLEIAFGSCYIRIVWREQVYTGHAHV